MNGAGDREIVKITYPHSKNAVRPKILFIHIISVINVFFSIRTFYPN